MNRTNIAHFRDLYRTGLLERVVPFWERHSVDREHGGFFMSLDRQGNVYGTDKPVWLQGRAVWLYATLYQQVEQRDDWLELARHGYDFLTQHAFDANGKMYFLLDRAGQPLRMRRYVYSEVFGIMAAAALHQATGEEEPRDRARSIFQKFLHTIQTPGVMTPKVNPDVRNMKGLAPLMCLISVADLMLKIDDQMPYEQIIDAATDEIFNDFVRDEDQCVLEAVNSDGTRLDEPDGRVMNPGHAIEAAWFMLEIARRRQNADLVNRAVQILDWSYDRGWDREFGGLYYFLDVAGKPPTQLEHDMKLWWPHCETLYASLLAWRLTGKEWYSQMFQQVHDYTFQHFPDSEHGEWFGYLRRDNALSTPLKGGTWKGPFHVPRALLLCWKLLEEAAGDSGG
jgi:N-acylglucosamine 2-epimerase